jgi:putative tricarboxylic transport membrane protein
MPAPAFLRPAPEIEQMQDNDADDSPTLATNRGMDIAVAIILLAVCGIVIFDSARLGFNWREGEGPAPGYFPFYVAVILGISSLVNLASAVLGRGAGEIFVSARPFSRVLAVLVPSLIYVAMIGGISVGPINVPGLGIYVASGLFIIAFMILIGRENPLRALGVGIAVPVALFLMFEKWFLVPLPKGPLEAWLGY